MTEEQTPSKLTDEQQNIRENMVRTAVNFLLNPAVISKPSVHKTAFLKKKGLTDAEISLAYKEAEKDPRHDEILRQSYTNNAPLPPPVPVYNKSLSFWSQMSKFSSSLIILGVALFGAHYVYKTYIEPLLFGEGSEKKKAQNLEKQIIEMANSLSELERNVLSLEEGIKCQKLQMDKFFQSEVNEYYPTPLALRELKTEIASVKSLLLNRHQFPAMPKVTPSIPVWQLPSSENEYTVKQNGSADEHLHPEELTSSESKSPSDINSGDICETIEEVNLEPKSLHCEHPGELNNDIPIS